MIERAASRARRGSAMVELSIVLPLLAFVLFATIEFGIALQRWQVLSNAAREATRANVVAGCEPGSARAQAQAIVDLYLSSAGIDPGEVVLSDNGNLCGPTGSFASVTLDYESPLQVVGSLVPALGSGIPLRGAATMRNE